jgi:uncharacterized membrane protein HdeD (DUF308 family)
VKGPEAELVLAHSRAAWGAHTGRGVRAGFAAAGVDPTIRAHRAERLLRGGERVTTEQIDTTRISEAAPPAVPPDSSMAGDESLPWWLGVIEGVVLIGLGLLALSAPGTTTAVLVQVLGLYWLIGGILGLVSLIANRSGWVLRLIASVLGIIAGVAIVQHPLWSTVLLPATLVVFVGAVGAVKGFLDLIHGISDRSWSTSLLGLAGIVLGLILLANPLLGAAVLPFIIGAVALVGGIAALFMAWGERRRRRERDQAIQDEMVLRDRRAAASKVTRAGGS